MVKYNLTLKDPRVLRSLQYFEAVARLGSVRKAAEERRVSASAVSHQMRELSDFIGEELYLRSGRGIRLTETGERLYLQIAALFEDLDRVLENAVGRTKPLIRIAVCSSVGPAWLAKRLPEFLQQNQAIDVELRMYAQDPLQSESTADIIVTADNVEAGFEAISLFEETLVAVGSTDMARNEAGLPLRLITTDLERHLFAEDWHDFSAETGLDYVASATSGIMRTTHYHLAMALAQQSVGAALVPDFLAADALRNGDLKLISPTRISARRTYKLCYKTSRAAETELKCFVRWIKARTGNNVVFLATPVAENKSR
jgi:LysR family glycine cleavage system transcriptional activator